MLNPILSQPVMEGIVAMVLAEHDGRRAAQAICSFAEAAHFPASLWVSVGHRSHVQPLIASAGQFSLAVLAENQAPLARAFGTTEGGDPADVQRLDLEKLDDGFLYLNGALATTACQVTQSVELEDQSIFFADILAARVESRVSHLRQLLNTEVAPR